VVSSGSPATVKLVLAHGADPAAREGDHAGGYTPLMVSIIRRKGEGLALLLAAHADVSSSTSEGETALMFAAHRGLRGVVRELIAAGADVNGKTRSGLTALMFAAMRDRTRTAMDLLAAGADPVPRNVHGTDAAQFARVRGNQRLADLLTRAARHPVVARGRVAPPSPRTVEAHAIRNPLTAAWRCPTKDFGVPRDALVPGCDRASCVDAEGYRLCKCRSDSDDALPMRFILEAGLRRIGTWPAAESMGETDGFEAGAADLDGDGRDEWYVADFETQSNGMATRYWTLHVRGNPLRASRSWMGVEIEDYAPDVVFARPGVPGCAILATSWESDEDPARPSGIALVGRTFSWRAGRLLPERGAPIVTRRFLGSFWAPYPDSRLGGPRSWLADPMTEPRHVDPFFDRTSLHPRDEVPVGVWSASAPPARGPVSGEIP